MMQAVVLAAGMGTRLRPVTANRSKAMVPVLGRPLVERALMPFFDNGIRDFVFVISPDDREITEHFTERTSLEMTVRFVVQQDRLGTAHALGLAAPFLNGPFAVTACDSLVDASHIGKLLREGDGSDGALSLLDVEPELVSRSASVMLDGHSVCRIVEKPAPGCEPSHTVSLPHYVFSLRLLDLLPGVEVSPRGEYELADAIQGLIDAGRRVVGVRAEKRLQVSSSEDLLRLTRRFFAQNSEPREVDSASVGSRTKLVEPLRVERGAVVGDDCELGPEVFLESGCEIGRGAVVRRSIVLRDGRVGDGEIVEDQVVV
jgi:bifunctional UDP-N-acetylglucosamine pyrophosphorylase/glucosamine-1-phosphate N-acetyltransferase